MTYSDLDGEILRLFEVEKWPIGTISKELRVHHSVIKRVLQARHNPKLRLSKISILEPYLPFIQETLEKYPLITAARIYQMLHERGYKGISDGLVRNYVKKIRPKKFKEAFLPLSSLPGEQAQVDWAEFGVVKKGTPYERKLYGFVMTLSHSRAIFLRFFHSMTSRDFYQGIAEGFYFFQGVPRKLWMDNLKSGVTSRCGPLIQYNEKMLVLSAHFKFEPVAMNIRRGNEKGKVERSIGYIRTNFYAGRDFHSLENINEEALTWCLEVASKRRWVEQQNMLVSEAYQQEKERLLPLPDKDWVIQERFKVNVPKVPLVRFDSNFYSVPWKQAQCQVWLEYDDRNVRFLSETDVLCSHKRSYAKGHRIENSEHFKGLIELKKSSREHHGYARLKTMVPMSTSFMSQLVQHGQNAGGMVTSLLRMLDAHGAEILNVALEEVLELERPNLRALHYVLSKLEKNEALIQKPLLQSELPKKMTNLTVQYHTPNHYDFITGIEKNESGKNDKNG